MTSASFSEAFTACRSLAPRVSADRLSLLLSFAYGVGAEESGALGLPAFPLDALPAAAALWVQASRCLVVEIQFTIQNLNPNYTPEELIGKLYPYKAMLRPDSHEAVRSALEVRLNFSTE